MTQVPPQHDRRHRDEWLARLVRVNLAAQGFVAPAEPCAIDDRWPARLVHAGAILMIVSGLALAAWLRRHL
jgi:hypothetical protein